MADKELNELENEAVVETEEVADTAVAEEAEAKKDKKSDKKAKSEEKKPNFFVRIGMRIKKFWKTMKSELKKVTWFSRKQTFTSTLLVLVVMVVAGVAIGLLDLGFAEGLKALTNLF